MVRNNQYTTYAMKLLNSLTQICLLIVFITIFSSCERTEMNINAYANEVLPAGEQNSSLILEPNKTYYLNGKLIMNKGTELSIPEGTKIIVTDTVTDVYIAILAGAKINIHGTASNPVLISSEDGKPGDWCGIIICGMAETTGGTNSETETDGFYYGGNDATDHSGTIEYLVLKGTGTSIGHPSYPAICLYAVGSGTKLENIAIINGEGDGLSFHGGAVNAQNIYIENCEDDAIDWTEGWEGSISNTYVKHDINGFSTAIEGDGVVNNNPKFINFTTVCTSIYGGMALQFKGQSGATISGLFLQGYHVDLQIKDNAPLSNIIVENNACDVSLIEGASNEYKFISGVQAIETVDISQWIWVNASF